MLTKWIELVNSEKRKLGLLSDETMFTTLRSPRRSVFQQRYFSICEWKELVLTPLWLLWTLQRINVYIQWLCFILLGFMSIIAEFIFINRFLLNNRLTQTTFTLKSDPPQKNPKNNQVNIYFRLRLHLHSSPARWQ